MKTVTRFLLVLALLGLAGVASAEEKCLTCHEGIEKISEVDGMDHLTCTDCHMGDAKATTLDAHKGMYANPSDFRIIDKTCGTCHPEEVENNIKSLHSTSAGKISGTRYDFGAQSRDAIYGNYAVAGGIFPWDSFDRDDTAAMLRILSGHLRKTSRLSGNQVIRQMHKKRFIADGGSRTKHSVPKPQRLTLSDVNTGHAFGNDVLNGP